ncbi:MAG: DUF488 family protein [Candidatus Aenigmarchaeota archaeon]|nr:DUF488 family protein [Candidatus Aenigmarchaeota archaeon]
MALYTKSIFEYPLPEDGTRISVMSRHTNNDGITLDPRIKPGHTFTEWLPQLSPSPRDVGAYYRKKIKLQDLLNNYSAHLKKEYIASKVRELAERAVSEDITILCVEENAAECHRGVLAEECRKYQPNLQVVHR